MSANFVLSVIVPIYNSEKTLRRCIDSILKQTLESIEIILVNDGSADDSPKICEEYKLKYTNRIRVIHKSNGGLVSARKAGILISSGTYIGFVDSDDWIEKEMYEILINHALKYDADEVISGRYLDYGEHYYEMNNKLRPGVYDKEGIKQHILRYLISDGTFFEWNIFPSLWDKIFKKSNFLKYQLSVTDSICEGEDAAVSVPYLASCNKVVVVDKCMYHYVQNSNSMVKKEHNYDDLNKYKELYYLLRKELIRNKQDDTIFSRQIKDYMHYIMTPRIMGLMNNYINQEYLLPFTQVKKTSKVILYGAGIFGLNMFRFLKKTNFCSCLGVYDQKYKLISSQEFPVFSPDEIYLIEPKEYDYIVITILNQNLNNTIKESLLRKGIEISKIAFPDIDFINSWKPWGDFEIINDNQEIDS